MKNIAPGRYIIAVSGGVDSMALVDMLRSQTGLELIVAHIDHGVREDSHLDRQLVEEYAHAHGLAFIATELEFGKHVSEETARTARYAFLRECMRTKKARGIITAHHQDDLVETAFLNILRGTGWRGIAPFMEGGDIVRPLLGFTKDDLIGYARRHNLTWREDSTNNDETYTRNYLRRTLIPLLDQKSADWRGQFLARILSQQTYRLEIEETLAQFVVPELSRYQIITLPQSVAYEVLQEWLKRYIGHSIERSLAESALLFAKVAGAGKRMSLNATLQLRATKRELIVEPCPSVVSLSNQ